MSSKKRALDPPPPSQLEHEEDVDSSSSSGDGLAAPSSPEQDLPHQAAAAPDAPPVGGAVPDLEFFFAQHPYFDAAQIVKLCRGYAAYKASTLPSQPAGKKKWPWSRREEDETSPAATMSFKHPRREEEPSEKRKKRYWEK